MSGVRRLLKIAGVAMLMIVVCTILVAPNFDLDPTLLRGKMAVPLITWSVVLLMAALACALVLRMASTWNPLHESFPSPLELTCSWIW